MLIFLLVLLLTSNSIATNKSKSVLYSRFTLTGLIFIFVSLYNSLSIKALENSIGLYNGLFNVSILSQSFNIFIFILVSIITMLTCFYSRKIYNIAKTNYSNVNKKANIINDYIILFLNKNGFQFTIIEYSLITLFVLSGAIFLTSVGDLVSLFLSIELQSYGLYIICTIYRNSESATGSGLTYFLLGGLSSCFILLGSGILYVNSGMTNLDNIYILNSINEFNTINGNMFNILSVFYTNFNGSDSPWILNYVNFSLIILTVGLLFKISAAPFHFWSPDVYDGIPTTVTTFVAIVAKISLLMLMLELVTHSDINTAADNIYKTIESNTENNSEHIYSHIGYYNYEWKNVLILSSLMSLIVGSLLGLTQYRIKRLFAYSTISHVGFILLALCVNNIESIQAYIFYIMQYSISNLNLFFILIIIGYTLYEYVFKPDMNNFTQNENKFLNDGKSNNTLTSFNNDKTDKMQNKFIDIENSPIQLLSQMKGYFYINSYLSLSFAITLFSFVGIPPLIGFFGKQMVLSAALDEGYIFITLIGIITSVIGAAYYLNVVKLIFFNKSDYIKNNIINNELDNTLGALKNNSNNNVILINDKLSLIVSVLTMLILFFIFMPDEWFKIVNILSLSINKY